jgi:hypothetical protein
MNKVSESFNDLSNEQLNIKSTHRNPVKVGKKLCMAVLVNREPSIRYIPLSELPILIGCLKTKKEIEDDSERTL